MPTLGKSLFEAEKINERIGKVLGKPYTDERRLTLPLAYVNLSLDDHRAIILLMRTGLLGSAMAFVRPTFEAMIRSPWVAKCATDTQIQEIAAKDDFRFPKMDDMAAAVDAALSNPNYEKLTFFQQHSGLMAIDFGAKRRWLSHDAKVIVSVNRFDDFSQERGSA